MQELNKTDHTIIFDSLNETARGLEEKIETKKKFQRRYLSKLELRHIKETEEHIKKIRQTNKKIIEKLCRQ